MSAMRVLGSSGHTTLEWDPPATKTGPLSQEAQKVKAEFDTLISQNFLAFNVGPDSKSSERIKDFDPQAKNITMVPPMAGGC